MALTQLTKEEILERAKVWTKAPYSKECIDEISGLIAAGDDKELAERFSLDLDFGTGGMRGLIRFGTNGMNVYTVAKASASSPSKLIEKTEYSSSNKSVKNCIVVVLPYCRPRLMQKYSPRSTIFLISATRCEMSTI